MTEDQLNAIAAMMAGMQMSIVALARITARKAGISEADVAQAFEATAEGLPPGPYADLMAMSVRQVARGLLRTAGSDELAQEVAQLLH